MPETYFISTGARQEDYAGPFTLEDIIEMARNNRIQPNHHMTTADGQEWTTAAKLPELSRYLPLQMFTTKKRRDDTNANLGGCLMICLALLCLALGPVGWVIALILLILGGMYVGKTNWECNNCGAQTTAKAPHCPGCNQTFSN